MDVLGLLFRTSYISGLVLSNCLCMACVYVYLSVCVYVVRQDIGRMRHQLIESVVPYLNAARQIVADSCQLVAVFICVLVLVDLLSAVAWIYLRRSV